MAKINQAEYQDMAQTGSTNPHRTIYDYSIHGNPNPGKNSTLGERQLNMKTSASTVNGLWGPMDRESTKNENQAADSRHLSAEHHRDYAGRSSYYEEGGTVNKAAVQPTPRRYKGPAWLLYYMVT